MTGLFSDDMRRNPYPAYEQMRSRSPVFHDPHSGLWMILDYDGVKQALYDHDAFTSGYGPDWLIFSDPPRHTKLRALISKAFTPRSVASLEPRIRELVHHLLEQTMERGEMDLALDFAIPLPMLVIAEMLGTPGADRPQLSGWSDVILEMSYTISDRGSPAARSASERFAAASIEMDGYLLRLLEERRAAPKDDLLTRLAGAEVDGERLTRPQLLGFFQLLLLAGSETTTNLINNAVLCFLEHPEQLARLRASPVLLSTAIEEVLRYRSPLQWMYRVTRHDVEFQGQTIPAEQLVLAVIGAANRDPRHFPEADRFDVTRDPNPHLAFGHGVHFCLGAALARLETRIALTELLERAKGLQRATQEPWQPRRGSHVLGPNRLPIRFEPELGSKS